MNVRRSILLGLATALIASLLSSCVFAARRLYRDLSETRAHSAAEFDAASLGIPDLRIVRDVAYAADPAQRFDVYAKAGIRNVPVIFMIHGGAWMIGDKDNRGVIENKIKRWVAEGFVLISVDYPMLPSAAVDVQARSIAQALAAAQRRAAEWGGDAGKFILMGHSAGAHLVSLIASQPRLAKEAGTQPWIGTVALDSAAYDVARILRAPHLPLYDRAFGGDPAYWATVSPLPSLAQRGAPFLAVCSSRRRDSCAQADAYVRKAHTLGTRASMLEENLSHAEIDRNLGEAGAYTDAVESFLSTLDPGAARLLRR